MRGLGPVAEIQSAAACGAAARVEARAADAASIAVRKVCLIRITKSFPRLRSQSYVTAVLHEKSRYILLSLFLPPTVTGGGHLITF